MKQHGATTLGTAQALAWLAAAAAGTVYARWLDAPTLAAWALALAAARASLVLLDAGLKTTLVRHASALSAAAEKRLQRGVALAAIGCTAWVVVALNMLVSTGRLGAPAAALVACAVAAYTLSHAGLLTGLARLERAGRFDAVGRAEGLGTVLEFVLPAVLLLLALPAWLALALGVLAGRLVRTLWIALAARRCAAVGAPAAGPATLLWRDALAVQAIAMLALLRDHVHLWLVAPWFGAAWAGAYAFALLVAALASQVLVASVSRLALPALRARAPSRRPLQAARLLRPLVWWTLPLLALAPLLLAWADSQLWQGRWADAQVLLPALVLRMALALPLAVLAPWLLLAGPAAAALRWHAAWTLVELLLAALLLAWLGPTGLAWAWALGGALGTALFAAALRGQGLRRFAAALLRRAPRHRHPQRGPAWQPKSMSC